MIPTATLPRFTLPGTWLRIDLRDESATDRSVRSAVERLVGRSDQLASQRAEMRRYFRSVADQAREATALEFYLALEIVPGVPFATSLSVHRPSIDLAELDGAGLGRIARVLDQAVPDDDGARTALELLEVTVVRQSVRRRITPPGVDVELPGLRVDYWVAADRPVRLAVLSFTTAHVELEPEVLTLLDAVVSTITWPAE